MNEDSQSTLLKMAGLYGAALLAINGYEETLISMASKIYRVSPGIGQQMDAD
jgi:MFS-type transporter involved in bile tolerance (Atg22 family)